MHRFKEKRMLLLIAVALFILIASIILMLVSDGLVLSLLFPIITGIFLVAFIVVVVNFVMSIKKEPVKIKTSILGASGSGKTVYTTVLFNKLDVGEYSAKNFSLKIVPGPTNKKVISDYADLKKGKPLPSTTMEDMFFYHASAETSSQKNVLLEVGDYPGRKFDEKFLYQTEYFYYICQSDIVLLVVDLERTLSGDDVEYAIDLETNFRGTLNALDEKNGVSSKPNRPIALLFLKTDIVSDSEMNSYQETAKNTFRELISYCNKNYANFEIFFVTSLGKDYKPNEWPIRSCSVVEPILWALEKMGIYSVTPS